jgi:transposase
MKMKSFILEPVMSNYNKNTVFIDIDVHKKTYSVTCISNNEILKQSSMPACPEKLVKYINKHFPNYTPQTAYEAGFCGFSLHRELTERGISNQVINPASIEIAARDRVKTDKRDSLKIAVQLSREQISGIHVPCQERESFRELTRLRVTLIQDKTRLGNRIKSMLYRLGRIKYNETPRISDKWIQSVLKGKYDEYSSFAIESLCNLWLNVAKEIDILDVRIKKQAANDLPMECVYRSAPGIGPVHARILANELEDMSHFKNEKKLFSYTGLTPSEHSSGEHVRQGHISRQGRSILRKVLVQASWVAIKLDPSLREIYERISLTAGKKKAIIGIARRLIGRIRACFVSGNFYQIAEKN